MWIKVEGERERGEKKERQRDTRKIKTEKDDKNACGGEKASERNDKRKKKDDVTMHLTRS